MEYDRNGLQFTRSISAAILNDGIVLPIRVVQELIDIKEIEQKGESRSMRHNKLTQSINNNLVL
jgi:hypothetical protein